jgi:hypothetical protein
MSQVTETQPAGGQVYIHVARGMYMLRADVERIQADNEQLRECWEVERARLRAIALEADAERQREQEEADAREREQVELVSRWWLANEVSMSDEE